MLWEGEPLPDTVRRLEALGVRSVVFDPCAAAPNGEDWLASMRENALRLTEALTQTH